MGAPYREQPIDGRKLEPDARPRRRVKLAGLTTAALGVGIGATAPVLGPLAAVLGGGVALLGLALYREAPERAMKAPCPACAEEIAEIDPGVEVVRCGACGEHARPAPGMLVALRDDFVARAPIFPIPVRPGMELDLPPICAECGASGASRAVVIEVAVPPLPLTEDGGSIELVPVPHCAEHERGASGQLGAVRVRAHALWLAATQSGWSGTAG